MQCTQQPGTHKCTDNADDHGPDTASADTTDQPFGEEPAIAPTITQTMIELSAMLDSFRFMSYEISLACFKIKMIPTKVLNKIRVR